MSQYQGLADFLGSQKGDGWEASFAEVEAALGRPLPRSAHKHAAWWANQSTPGHSQTHGWRSVGWRTAALDLQHKRVRFERDRGAGKPAREPVPSASRNALLVKARELTGLTDEAELVARGLEALIAREAARQVGALGGTMPDFAAPPRDRA